MDLNEFFGQPQQAGAERIRAVLGCLGNPQNSFRAISVAGTNGKGSTATMIAEGLARGGYKTGLFTSPHLSKINECIRICGKNVSTAKLRRAAQEVQHGERIASQNPLLFARGCSLSGFERLTASAIIAFKEAGCTHAVIEAGMGGADDATNVFEDSVAVITSIGLDHTHQLGSTVAEIARAKAGIIKGSFVLAPQASPSAAQVFAQRGGIEVEQQAILYSGGRFEYKGIRCVLSLKGRHQADNAAAAVETLRLLGVDDGAITAALQSAKIKARLQVVHENPRVYLDGCHNPDGAEALCGFLLEQGGATVIFGAFKDKDYMSMCRILARAAGEVFTVATEGERGLSAQQAAQAFSAAGKMATALELDEAAERALRLGKTVVVAGSMSIMAQAEKVFKAKK